MLLSEELKRGRGRPSWVVGTKLRFFTVHSKEWQDAKDNNCLTAFYNNITKKFIAKYGWAYDIWQDKECPDATPEQWANITDTTGLSPEEIAQRQEYFKDTRKVSNIVAAFGNFARAYPLYAQLGDRAMVPGIPQQAGERRPQE